MKKEYSFSATMWILVLSVVIVGLGLLLEAWVMLKIIGWYALPELSYLQCVGLLLISSFFRNKTERKGDEDLLASLSKVMGYAVFLPLWILAFSFAVRLFV